MKLQNLLLLFWIILSAEATFGQVTISGKTTDTKSQPIPNTSVHLLNTNYGTVSDEQGMYSISNVAPGQYVIIFSGTGYAGKSDNIIVQQNMPAINTVLEPSENRLEEVVVTAQKKEELIQQLPLSITALSSKKVDEFRLWDSKNLVAIVPNLYTAEPGDKRDVTSIRGITSTSYDPAVATYIDGVNQFTLDTYISPLFDVERVEVLRGPQGTLYGRNAMGGVINIITRQPTNKTDAFAEISIGNYGQHRFTAGMKTPIIKDKLFFGAAGLYDGSNGFYTNEFNGSNYDKQHTIGGNYYLKYLASNKLVFTLNVKNNSVRNNGAFPLGFVT